jgi:hypothetical protein
MLLRRSEQSEQRVLAVVGAVVLLFVAIAGYLVVANPFRSKPSDSMLIAIDTPYVGQGVHAGTPLVMHGVQIGVVTQKSTLPGGGVRLLSDLRKGTVSGLTDAMAIDFRPINYFGVTGVNVVAGQGGQQLRDGMKVSTVPQDNSTLQALLSRLGQVSAAAITPKLISVIDRVVQYTDGLNPLLETMLIVSRSVADVQTVPTARLLANATGISVAFPSFTDATVTALRETIEVPRHFPRDWWIKNAEEATRVASTELFGGTGRLESNYVDSLLPSVDLVKMLVDPVPALLRPEDFASTLVQLRTRYEKLFAGSGDRRAVQVKIVLDSLPGVAAPLDAMGGPQ